MITLKIAAAGLLIGSFCRAEAQTYKFETVKHGAGSVAMEQNTAPNVSVGNIYHTLKNGDQVYSCFVLTGHTKTRLADPKQRVDNTYCSGINKSGTIVGNYQSFQVGGQVGFVEKDGKFTDVTPLPGSRNTVVSAINDKGVMVGNYQVANNSHEAGFIFDGTTYRTVELEPGAEVSLRGINDKGQITGDFFSANYTDSYAFLLDGKKLTKLAFPGAQSTSPRQINNHGQVALVWLDAQNARHGGVYDSVSNTYTAIDVPGALGGSDVEGIDDRQTLSGYSISAAGTYTTVGFVAHGKLTN